MSARRFNRLCLVLALLWLVVTIPLSILWRPTSPDFAQFYMGGLIARRGEWRALYPIPLQGSLDNPGLWLHSKPKPRWSVLRQMHQVPDDTRFILPPPSALLFIPFSFTTYERAFWIWTFLLIGCAWGVALIAARLYRCIVGHPSRCEGALVLLVVLSPMTFRSIRIANVSPPIALLLGMTLLALVRQKQPLRGAVAVLLGSVLKYATLVLVPLFLAMRRWKMLIWLALLGAALLLVTVNVAGTAPFVEFYKVILPTLSRASIFRGNQSLPGMLERMYGKPLNPILAIALTCARLGTLALILRQLLRVPQREWSEPVTVMAGAALLVGWLLVFSPIAWEHWPVFLCPVWGWLLWEARVPNLRGNLALTSLVLMYVPAGILQVKGIAMVYFLFPEPFNSTQLFGAAFAAIVGHWRLARVSARPARKPLWLAQEA